MIVKIEGTCQYPKCLQPADTIASAHEHYESKGGNDNLRIGCYCYDHARLIQDLGSPEYTVRCPNCDCHFGVN